MSFNPCSDGSVSTGAFYVYRLKFQRFKQIVWSSQSPLSRRFFLQNADTIPSIAELNVPNILISNRLYRCGR